MRGMQAVASRRLVLVRWLSGSGGTSLCAGSIKLAWRRKRVRSWVWTVCSCLKRPDVAGKGDLRVADQSNADVCCRESAAKSRIGSIQQKWRCR